MQGSQNKKNEFSMNLFKIIEDYFEKILEDVSGMKALILDKETSGIISLICSQSQILKKGIYLLEKIENPSNDQSHHLNAIYFVRPTEENIQRILNEIKNRRFSEYNLFFSNTLNNLHLEKLAHEDEKNVIKRCVEVFSDFFVLNEDLFSLNILNSSGFRKEQNQWNQVDNNLLERMINGITAACLALRRCPSIRYQTNSKICETLAVRLDKILNSELSDSPKDFVKSKTTLLIMDRREDPITPLLNQWTYQAMLHELIGIKTNVIDLRKDKTVKDEEAEFVLSPHIDHFYSDHLYDDFGEIASSVKKELDEYSNIKKQNQNIESIEEMQRVLDSMPDIKRKANNVSKHLNLVSELSRIIKERDLTEMSRMEQEITVKENKSEHLKGVLDILGGNFNKFDKLKLALIYCLRYENDTSGISTIKKKLVECDLSTEMIELVDHYLKFASKKNRVGDLFSSGNMINKFTSKLKTFKDCPNVYTQHIPYLSNIIENLMKGKLKETEFKAIDKISNEKPNDLIIFIVGGVTYEEAKVVGELNSKGSTIILGGTNIINSKLFLGEINEFEKESRDVSIKVDSPLQSGKTKDGYARFD